MLGMRKNEIRHIVDRACLPSITFRQNADLAKKNLSDLDVINIIEQAVSEAIVKNNEAIEKQLKDAGVIS